MTNYTLHLGFDTNSPVIGSIWKPDLVPESYYFLQYALGNNGTQPWSPDDLGAPAWFQFWPREPISIVLWDTSPSPVPMSLDLAMALSYLDADQTYDPSDYMSFEGIATMRKTSGTDVQYYLDFARFAGPQNTPAKSPWGTYTTWYSIQGAVSFTKLITGKLSFRLRAEDSGPNPPQVFVSDPEVIVGSTGNPD